MRKIKWGVLSTAKIGTEKVIPAMQNGQHCEILAIASRDSKKAETASKQLGIPRFYGSYEALLDDPEIEAIYNPLPNHLHVPWSIRALEAGKHVLCEKPIALSSKEAETLVSASQKFPELKIMEAFMYRFHPQWQQARDWIHEGKIGSLRTVHSIFSYFNSDPNNIRNMADIGGGGLMDIGCYNISLSRFLFNDEPERVISICDIDPEFQTDRLTSGMMEFPAGTSTFTCSTQMYNYQRVHIFGTAGRIEIEIPFNPPNDKPCRMWIHGAMSHEKEIEICDQYTLQGDQFSLAILNDLNVPTPLADAVANMRVIEAIQKSAEQKCPVRLSGEE